MKAKYAYFILALTIAVSLAAGGCGAGSGSQDLIENPNPVIPGDNQNVVVNPNPVTPPEDPVEKALKDGPAVTWGKQTDCDNSFVLEAVKTLCELFGAGSCLQQTSSCNSYARQIYTGSVLGVEGQKWNSRGGSGQLMADAALCTLRELSPKVPGGGPIHSEKPINIGIGDVVVKQEVGYLDFDRVNARFKGYRKLRVELPVLGKFDAITQNIDIRKVYYGTAFNPHPFAGDHEILYAYGLNLFTEEKDKSLEIKPPAFDVYTPIGIFQAQPTFKYGSNTVVADAPLVKDHTYIILPNDDYDNSPAAIKLSDLYGVVPGVESNATSMPSMGDYKAKRTGWVSQIGLGTRGSGSDKPWSSPSSVFFNRPDYDPAGVLDFESYESRSNDENLPSVYAEASASLKFPKYPKELLPGWVFDLPGISPTAYIQVTPTIKAGAAGQFGISVSEGTDNKPELEGEFYVAHPVSRVSALGIYSGVEANASFDVLTELRIYVAADFGWPIGDITLLDINPHFDIPLAGDTVASNVDLATSYSSSGPKPDFPEKLDSLTTFKGPKLAEEFINLCYAKETEIPPEEPPKSETEKGNPEDLFEFMPCNICFATDAVINPNTGEVKEPAHQEILGPANTEPVWECDAKSKSGCMDLCKLDKTTGEFTVVKNPSEIADGIPVSDPLHAFYKSCMIPCDLPPGLLDTSCGKGLDSTPPGIGLMVPGGGGAPAPVPVDTNIAASFTEPMDPASVNTSTFTVSDADGYNIVGDVTYVAATYTAVFTPFLRNFDYNTMYTATITTGVMDVAGNPLAADFSWNFTTEAVPDVTPPAVVATDPSRDATAVPVNSAVSATFSEPVDPLTITPLSFFVSDGRENVSGLIFFTDDDKTVIFVPSADLTASTTYTVTLTADVKDPAGNALAEEYIWSFTTAPAAVGGGRIVFVSSVQGSGDLSTWADATRTSSGIAAGDTICKAKAEAAGLPNAANFKAWLSDSTTNAIDRITSDGQWFRPDGEKVADSKADLTDRDIDTTIDRTEAGDYLSTTVWTGTGRDGLLSIEANTCDGWTSSADINNGTIGESVFFDGRWSHAADSPCSNLHSLYCFED